MEGMSRKDGSITEALTYAVANAIEKAALRRALDAQRQAVVESGERFHAIADYTYDWESWIGPDGRPRWINAAVERFTGWSAAECMDMVEYPLPLIHEADRQRMAAQLQTASAGASANDVEFRVVQKGGAEVWAAASWQPIFSQRHWCGYRSSVRARLLRANTPKPSVNCC